jgi:serine phosphatase RsbU (regulator of sigma subunit)
MSRAREGRRELFGLERLDRLLAGSGGADPAQCIERIRQAVTQFREEAPATDDQTLIALRCL